MSHLRRVHKASPIGAVPVTDAELFINMELPEMKTIAESLAIYQDDAAQVMLALAALPSGTRTQLLILMLKAQEDFLRIAR